MGISKIHKWERAVTMILNVIGWDLEWTGGKYESFDARGYTPKNKSCIIEYKFRDKYYEEKPEEYIYSKLLNENNISFIEIKLYEFNL